MLYIIEEIGLRDYQEDRHHVILDFYKTFDYLAVFDGHGDDKVSTFLKLYFPDILKTELKKENSDSIEKKLFDAFVRLNEVLPKSIALHSGSTALIILRDKNTLYVANIGDSRAVIDNNNQAVALTVDHKPDLDSEYRRIIQNGGFVSKDPFGVARVCGTLAMSRAVGDFYLHPYISYLPDIFSVKINKGNKFLVAASDGIWDVISNQDVVDFVNKGLHNNDLKTNPRSILNTITRTILKESRIRGSGDNVTILLLIL